MEAGLSKDDWTQAGWTRCFWAFALGHVVIWTIVPALTQPNGPLDTMEMLYWGREWQWGYYKHPPLPAWLAQAASGLFGNAIWPTYLVSQLCILACLWAAWRMMRDRVAPWVALCAAALIEASAFYNYTTPELNNNMLRRGMTALSVLFIYWAMTRRRLAYWLAGGALLGLGLLSKYDHGLVIVSILAFAVINRQARPLWRTAGPYLLAAVAIGVFLPHVGWMANHDFITLEYVRNRTSSGSEWLAHLVNPLKFAGQQFAAVALMLLMLTPVLGWRWKLRRDLDDDDRMLRDYLAAVVLGPFLITVILSCLTGSYVRSMLGAPMWMFLPALLLLAVKRRCNKAGTGNKAPSRSEQRPYLRLTAACAVLSLVLAVTLGTRNLFGTALQQKPLRIDFPGRQLAAEVQQRWRRHADGPLPIVGGHWWPAANVGFYLPRRASVYADMTRDFAPWTSDAQLNERGGVILWEIRGRSDGEPQDWLDRFPRAIVHEPIVIPHRKAPGIRPLRIGLAVVPPTKDVDARALRRANTAMPGQRPSIR